MPAAPPCCREGRILYSGPSISEETSRIGCWIQALSRPQNHAWGDNWAREGAQSMSAFKTKSHDTRTLGHCPGAAHQVAAQSDSSKPKVAAQKVAQLQHILPAVLLKAKYHPPPSLLLAEAVARAKAAWEGSIASPAGGHGGPGCQVMCKATQELGREAGVLAVAGNGVPSCLGPGDLSLVYWVLHS